MNTKLLSLKDFTRRSAVVISRKLWVINLGIIVFSAIMASWLTIYILVFFNGDAEQLVAPEIELNTSAVDMLELWIEERQSALENPPPFSGIYFK